MEEKIQIKSKLIIVVSGIICMLILAISVVQDKFTNEYLQHQSKFKKILISKAKTEKELEAAHSFKKEIRQVILDDFNTVDRCISCHCGIDDPRMADQKSPYKNHSGDYLMDHPVDKYGCTVCHQGQGRALSKDEAMTIGEGHWEHSLLPKENLQASCGKCHLTLHHQEEKLAEADVLNNGRKLFLEKGCLSCHKVRGFGGIFSTDLTNEGNKTKLEFSFAHIEGEHTVSNWLKEHFVNPQKIAPGSQMMAYDLNEKEINELTTFVMGLFDAKFPLEYYSTDFIKELKSEREEYNHDTLFSMLCAICHGIDGVGKDYKEFESSIPSLNNQSFLSIASEEMIRYTLKFGRSGRLMPAWSSKYSGLTENELNSLVHHIQSWESDPPEFSEFIAAKGNKETGKILYQSHCGTCHGTEGKGGITSSVLNNQDLLKIASDEYLFKTMIKGRKNTAMPSWSNLSAKELADIVSYIRNWQKVPSLKLSDAPVKGNNENGKLLFDEWCIDCHGSHGQGGEGPAILNTDFLEAASDQFIARSTQIMAEGLIADELNNEQINNIVSYMRSTEIDESDIIYNNEIYGDPSKGEVLFKQMCSECHGVNGEGKQDPALNNQEFLTAATDGFLLATIVLGRNGTDMRSLAEGGQGYEELSKKDINNIISFIRSWQKTSK